MSEGGGAKSDTRAFALETASVQLLFMNVLATTIIKLHTTSHSIVDEAFGKHISGHHLRKAIMQIDIITLDSFLNPGDTDAMCSSYMS